MSLSSLKNHLNRLKLKTKIFLSFLMVIMLLSVVIAVFTRWVLITSLTNELKLRGLGIASSLAESCKEDMLAEDALKLKHLISSAQIGFRQEIVGYIFILDGQGKVVAHTFTKLFPKQLESQNKLESMDHKSIEMVKIDGETLYDVAVSIDDGQNRIGTVRVGLKRLHIDQLMGKLRTTFLGFLSLMTFFFFGISHFLSRYITHPISELTCIFDEIARSDSGFQSVLSQMAFQCWKMKSRGRRSCPGYEITEMPCWYLDGTIVYEEGDGKFPEKFTACESCDLYHGHVGDEVAQLAYSFANMARRLKLKEDQLKESEQNYRLLVDNLPNIVFKGYADGSIDFFDDKIEVLSGYKKDDFLARRITMYDIIYEPDLENAQKHFKEALKGDGSYVREYRMKSKSGDLVWVEESSQIIFNSNGRIGFISGAFLDISKRKKAEEALFLSEEKYHSLFDSDPTPTFLLDSATFNILDANPIAEETYGYTRSELIGKSFSEMGTLGFEQDLPLFSEIDVNQKIRLESHKEVHYKKGDVPFYVRVTACPIRFRDRTALILSTSDITEMIEKDAQLAQASKMNTLGEMSAGIAHELNQPLNAIKMGNEYIKLMMESRQAISPEDLNHVATEVSEQVDRASEIINRLRDFSRKPRFQKENIDINRPIQNVLRILKQQLNLLDIIVKTDLHENIPVILAENNPLEQVFFNLITNARDAIAQKASPCPENRVITIRTFSQNNTVIAAVEDTGLGIPEDVRQRILEPFFTTKEVGKGMGLGLYITYGIIRDYDGEIEIQSREGEGTTIKIVFPVHSQGAE